MYKMEDHPFLWQQKIYNNDLEKMNLLEMETKQKIQYDIEKPTNKRDFFAFNQGNCQQSSFNKMWSRPQKSCERKEHNAR